MIEQRGEAAHVTGDGPSAPALNRCVRLVLSGDLGEDLVHSFLAVKAGPPVATKTSSGVRCV